MRSANTGVSAFYDRLGRRRMATRLYRRVSATGTVHLYSDLTLYTRLGDWPAHIAWIFTLGALIVSLFRRRKSAA